MMYGILFLIVIILLIAVLVIKVLSSGIPLMMKLSKNQFQYLAPYIYIFDFLFEVNQGKITNTFSLYFDYVMCKDKYFVEKLLNVSNNAEEYSILKDLLRPEVEIIEVSRKKLVNFLEYNLIKMSPKKYVTEPYINWYFYIIHLAFRNECLKLVDKGGSYQVTLAALLIPEDPVENDAAYYSKSLYISSNDEKNVSVRRIDKFAIKYILDIKIHYNHHDAVEFFNISSEVIDRTILMIKLSTHFDKKN